MLEHGLPALTIAGLWAAKAPWHVSLPISALVRALGKLLHIALAQVVLDQDIVRILLENAQNTMVGREGGGRGGGMEMEKAGEVVPAVAPPFLLLLLLWLLLPILLLRTCPISLKLTNDLLPTSCSVLRSSSFYWGRVRQL